MASYSSVMGKDPITASALWLKTQTAQMRYDSSTDLILTNGIVSGSSTFATFDIPGDSLGQLNNIIPSIDLSGNNAVLNGFPLYLPGDATSQGSIVKYMFGTRESAFVYLAAAGSLYYSYDGISWNPSSPSGVQPVNALASNNTMILALGDGISYSTNGVSWSSSLSAQQIFGSGSGSAPGSVTAAAWNGGWIAVGSTGSSTVCVKSADGISWTQDGNLPTLITQSLTCIHYAASLWVAAGSGANSVAFSSDGVAWYPSTSGNMLVNAGSATSLLYAKNKWFMGITGGNQTTTLATSQDGKLWISASASASASASVPFTVAALATNGQLIVAVGDSIMYSTDGTSWKAAKTDSSGNFTSVTWNGAFMAGSPTGILTSPDGIQWTSAPAFSGPVTGLTRFTNTFGTLPCVEVQSTAPITLANKTLYIKFGKTAMDSALTTYLQYLAALAAQGMIPNTTPGQQNQSYVNKSLLPTVTAGTTFTIGTTSITPTIKGIYSPTASYHLGDLVYYPDASGSLNMCLIGPDLRGPSYSVIVGIEPVEDPFTSPYWYVVVNHGWNTLTYVSTIDLALNAKAISTNYIFCDSNLNGTIFPANLTLQLSTTTLKGYTLFGTDINQLTHISSFGYSMGSNGPLYALVLDKPPRTATAPLYVKNGLSNFVTLNTYASNNYLSMNVASLGSITGNAVTQTTMSAISTASSSLAVVNSAISSMGTYGQLASLSYRISQNMATCLDQYSLGLQIYQSDVTLGNAARIPLTRANLLNVTSTITSIVSNVASASSYIASGDSSNTSLILSTITADAASLATTNSYYNNIVIPSDIGYSVFTNQYVEVIPSALSNLNLTGDFTIEWITLDSAPLIAEFGALNFWTSNANLMNPFGSSAVPLSALSSAAANPPYLNCSIGPNQNHFAWVRQSNTLRLYINGSSVYSTSTGVSGPVAGSNFVLGSNSSIPSLWQGGLRNFRVDTTAIYTSNFTTSPVITSFTNSVFTSNLSPLSTTVVCLPMNKSFIFNDFSPLHNSVSTMGESMSSVTLSYSTMITPFTQVPYGAGYLTLPALPTSVTMTPWSYPQTAVTATWSASTGATSYTVKFYYSLTNTTSGGTLLETVTTTTTSTSATTTTAIANGLFIYATVCANNQLGSSYSVISGTTYVDQPPTNVQMIPLTTGQTAMTVTWTAAPIVTTYTVSFYTNSTASTTGGTLLETFTGVTGTTKSSTLPLVYSTYYYATVVALTNVGTSTTATSSTAIQFTPPPSTPSGITMAAVPANTNTVSVSWSASAYSQSYTVSFYKNSTNSTSGGTLVQTLSLLSGLTATSQTLTAPGYYYATVTGVNTTGSSSPGTPGPSSASYYTPACGPVTNAAMSPYTGSGAVTVTWTAAQYAASYTVVFYSNSSNSTSGGSAAQTLTTTSTTQTSSISLTQGNYYYATVTATNPNLNSATVTTSTVLVVPIPAAPTGVTMTTWVTGVSAVTVSWSAVTNATSYTVKYYSKATNATSGGTLVQTVTATGTTSSSTAALSPAYYYATVVANNSTGSSAATTSSNTAFYNPFLPAPSTISVAVTSNVTASWTAVTNMYGTPTYTVSYYTGTSPSTTTLLTSVSGITALSNTPDVQLMYRNYYSASVVANIPGVSSLTTTKASSAIFIPTTVSPTYFPNMTYWFDAADSTSLTINSSSNVTAWTNKGTVGGSATLNGTFPVTTLNSLTTVKFNYQQYMNIPPSSGSTTGTSFFIVMKATSNLVANSGYNIITNPSGPSVIINANGSVINYLQDGGSAVYITNSANFSTFTTPTLISSVENGTTSLPAGMWNNGSNIAFSSGTGSSSTAFSAPTLGSSSAAGMPFQLAEIIIYTSNLPYTSRQAVEGYLAWKWGLQTSLPYNHPFAVYPTFSPLTLPGLQLWLDGTDPSATGQDYADGAALTSWNDKSGYGRNIAFYNIVGAQTTSSAASINNLSAVYLNSPNANGIRAFGAVPAGTFSNAYTTFAVYKFNSLTTPQVGYELSILSRTTSLTNQNLYMQAGESRYVGSTLVSDSTTSSNNWIVTSNLNTNILTTSITYPGGSNINFAEFLNGSQLSLLASNSPVTFPASTTLNDSNASSSISLANSNGSYLYSKIDIRYCEVLMFNQPFTTAQRQQVEGYLAAKWGVTSELPLTHPYRVSPTITPSLFPGNQLWLDATDPLGTGLTPASLTTWADKSGFAQNLVLTGAISPSNTSNGQGLVIPTSVSGKSYIPPNTFINALSYFAVYNSLSQTGVDAFINRGTQASPSFGPCSVYTNNTLVIADVNGSYSYTVGYIYQSNISIAYTSINQLSNTISQSLNGSFSNIAGVTAWVPNDPKSFVQFFDRDLGSGSGGLKFNGIVYEVLVFDRPFTTEQRQMMEGYLASKWNLKSNLPLLHPYKALSPIVSPTYEFTPLSITSLQLWLDGSDPLATGLAPFRNYNVNTWYDKSGLANHAIASNSPKFTASGISFNGANQSFVTPYTAASPAETGFIIVNMTSPATCPFITGASSNTSRQFWGEISTHFAFSLTSNANSYFTFTTTNAYSTTYLLSYTYNYSGVTGYQNGTTMGSNTSNIASYLGLGSGSSNPTIIGASVSGNSVNSNVSWMSGTISEVILYNSALSQVKRQQVEGYLAWKWGLNANLPTTHPYYLQPPENTVTITASAPIAPILVLQTAWGTGITLNWTPNSTVEFYQFIIGSSVVTPASQSLSNATFSGLTPNTSYTIQVVAKNSYGSASASITASTLANYNPLNLSGLQAWYDANDIMGNGTVLANGTAISTWYDKSGNARNATGSNGTTTVVNNSLYGLPGLLLTGSNYFGTSIPVGTFSSNYMWFAVYKNTATTGKSTALVNRVISGGSYANPALIWNTNIYLTGSNATISGANSFTMGTSLYNTTPSIFSALIHQDSILAQSFAQAFTTGSYIPFTTAGIPSTPYGDGGNLLLLGTEASLGSSSAFNGYFYEVLVFNSQLTNLQRNLVEGYLAWKWGLQTQLPSFHPFYTSSPTSTTTLTPSVPQKIPALQLWIDASDPLGTGTAPSNGTVLTSLADKSGFSNSIGFQDLNTISFVKYGTTLSNFPYGTYISGATPYILPCQSNNSWITAQIPPNTFMAGISVFLVYKSLSSNSVAPLITRTIAPSPTIAGNTGNFIEFQAAYYIGSNNASAITTGFNPYNPSINIHNLVINQTANTLSILSNGNSTFSGSGSWTPSDGGNILNIFARGDGGSTFQAANLYEAVAFNTVLTTTQRQLMEGYLAWKWGLQSQLPAAHPYKSSAPVA